MAALRATGHEEPAASFENNFHLSNSADVAKKYRWACDICQALEASFNADEAASIRQACRCGDGTTMAKEVAGCIRKAGNLSDGCTLFSTKNKYAFLDYVSANEVTFGYHACVCSCVKRADGLVPSLWCECSSGYAEAMFRQNFSETVQVKRLAA